MSGIESDMDLEESDDDGYEDYYNNTDDAEIDQTDPRKIDPEYFEYECLTIEDIERLLNENVEALCANLQVMPSLAKMLLHTHNWALAEVIQKYRQDISEVLADAKIKPRKTSEIDIQALRSNPSVQCTTCLQFMSGDHFRNLACGHSFCKDCWSMHFEIQIIQGVTTGIECMQQGCNILVPEDFVMSILNKSSLRERYQQFAFSDYVKSHPQLRYCPGPNCTVVVRAKESKSKHVICKHCKTQFCFKCGTDYHAPTDCKIIKKWLTKCADDSETANYISAHTKDCPKCHICIEKNGGCNHMHCYNCRHDFCWMCLGDWRTHGSEYYECSRYKENPNIANESAHAQAREALKKYLFYFERWENHAKSLRLEEQTLEKIKNRINEKVMSNQGTWIDWQYLLDGADLLAKCRYTLQYTYPYAYYMEIGPRKELFEYQQAQLEAEIENLSWKIERAETTDRGDLENQMDIAEKRRTTLLKDFLVV